MTVEQTGALCEMLHQEVQSLNREQINQVVGALVRSRQMVFISEMVEYAERHAAEEVRQAEQRFHMDPMLMEARRIVQAWTDEGWAPAYHHGQKRHLHKHWPMLYRAIDDLVKVATRGRRD